MAGDGCSGVKLEDFRIHFEEVKLNTAYLSAGNYIRGGGSRVKLEDFRIPFEKIKLATGDFTAGNFIRDVGSGVILEDSRIPFEQIKLGTDDFRNLYRGRWIKSKSRRLSNSIRKDQAGYWRFHCRKIEDSGISFEQIELRTRGFSAGNYIGGGGFGKVYKGKLSDFWIYKVAIKRLDPYDLKGLQGNHEFLNEISMLFSCKHENIINFIGYCYVSEEMIIPYEFAVNGSLDKYMSTMSREKCLKICIGAAKGLKYLHLGLGKQHRVIYHDIKSTNILVDENWEAKISDIGLLKIGHKDLAYTHLHTKFAAISPCNKINNMMFTHSVWYCLKQSWVINRRI